MPCVLVHRFFCLGLGNPLYEWECWARGTQSHYFELGGSPSSWYKSTAPHIPYDQPAAGRPEEPEIIIWTPGEWEGDVFGTYKAWPTRGQGGSQSKYLLPWGDSVDLCHRLQGSIGTYTPNRNKMSCWSWGTPSRFAMSDNGGADWEERSSVPFHTACFSGFPRSAQKVYCGRHATEDPTDDGDRSLIYVSWDRGETWHDVTGDLWTKTQALGLRFDEFENPLGASGLVTIAPRY